MRIAVITGASSGMGRQFAVQAATENYDELWIVARREERLKELARNLPVPVRIFALDLEERESMKVIQKALNEKCPRIDLLVNAAGFCKFGKTAEQSEAEVMGMISLNITALTALTLVCLPYMMKGGRIIQLSSVAAFQPLSGMNIYAASKAYVLHFSRALHRELKQHGITVTAVCPGWTKTEFFGVAKKTSNPGEVTKFPMMSRVEDVVRKALNDSKKGKELSVYGFHNQLQYVGTKLLPHRLIMTLWEKIKN